MNFLIALLYSNIRFEMETGGQRLRGGETDHE
jgi:hypothetical protein